MYAKEKSLAFLGSNMVLEIPFFQRRYVWTESNWEELLDNLLDKGQSHFLGSIIVKQENVPVGDIPRAMVIDGQQRLTTLSILIRAIYDTLPLDSYSIAAKLALQNKLQTILFYARDMFNPKYHTKIEHSKLDRKDYEKVIFGEIIDPENLSKIILTSEAKKDEKPSSNIFQCYKYFVKRLQGLEEKQRSDLFSYLLNENNAIIVKIDLNTNENEQAIFDTVNSAGVRLTCADTIKNALFQKAMENARAYDKKSSDGIIEYYDQHWYKTFEADQETLDFWAKEHSMGRMMRSNIEILLHCVAVIKGIFDPTINKLADLAVLYKRYIDIMDNIQLYSLIEEIQKYADIYHSNFMSFDNSSVFLYEDKIGRLFHVLDVCDISTFHPYILYLFKKYKDDELLLKLQDLESYVIRHIICNSTTKNFNKECILLIKGEKSIQDLYSEKEPEISNDSVRLGLNKISNKLASLLLFWVELKKRKESNNKADIEMLKYSYSLEHMMPQKWQDNWSVSVQPVYDENNMLITDMKKAEEVRQSCIYMIGNMTLLTTSLNSSLKNYEFSRKVNGEGKKNGVAKYADLLITKEVLDNYKNDPIWDERKIRERTKDIYNEVIQIWNPVI